ncbi:allantoin racemase [Nakamurella sp. UYEF19]|uniref:aspartate/glutamate racemase family protein n=1 Tax=Nakamurella sp. UYEF19 TaxID=1756392 RepID=UPI00339942A9
MSEQVIAIVNPNTTESMTRAVVDAASAVAGPHTELVGITPTVGPVTVETNADEVAGAAAVLAEVRRAEAAPDVPAGYVIACFGDTGLAAAKESARGPVVGMTQAALVTAALIAEHFCIITMPRRTLAMSQRVVREMGLEHRCTVRAVDEDVAAVAEGSLHLLDLFLAQARAALVDDNAEAIILGCAGLADLLVPLREALGIPVIEGVAAAVGQVEALLAQRLSTSRANTFATAGEAP